MKESFTNNDDASEDSSHLSSRGERMLAPATSYLGKHFAALADPWSPSRPPGEGYVSLAVAENKLTYDVLRQRLPPLSTLEPEVAQYENMRGTSSFRQALAHFLQQRIFASLKTSSSSSSSSSSAKIHSSRSSAEPSRILLDPSFPAGRTSKEIDPDLLCVSTGVGSLLNHLAHALFEEGDGVLIPSPSYASFDFDLKVLARVRVLPVPLVGPEYRLTREALKETTARYEAEGVPVRGLIITNPHNPLGIIYSTSELKEAVAWHDAHPTAHLISDEIYALSILNTNDNHNSPASFSTTSSSSVNEQEEAKEIEKEKGDSRRGKTFQSILHLTEKEGELGPRIHILWGFSKDFGISGFRVGVLLTHNRRLLRALDSVSYFCAVPNPVQAALTEVIQDGVFLDHYIEENNHRLIQAYHLCIETLNRLGIPFLPANSGMFLWIDLLAFLAPSGIGQSNGNGTSNGQPTEAKQEQQQQKEDKQQQQKKENDPFPVLSFDWSAEQQLFEQLVNEVRLVLTPGESNHADRPGYFRLCYAFYADTEVLKEGLRRLEAFVLKHSYVGYTGERKRELEDEKKIQAQEDCCNETEGLL